MKLAYATGLTQQLARLQERLGNGMPRLGWKIGLNVPEIQRKLGLAHALVGWLDGDRARSSGDTIAISPHSKLHVEPELCIRVGKAVRGGVDRNTASAAVDAIAPALELVDYAMPAAHLDDVVSSSMFHAGCVLGAWQSPRESLDISREVAMYVGDLSAEPARADLVPAQLGELVLFVAARLEEAGQQLLAGDHILSGSFTSRALPLRVGQAAQATLGDFGLVRCSA